MITVTEAFSVAIHPVLTVEAVHLRPKGAFIERAMVLREAQGDLSRCSGYPRAQSSRDHIQQIKPLCLRQLAHQSHIQEGDDAGLGIERDVAGMRIAVEEAVDQELLHHGADHGLHDDRAIQPCRSMAAVSVIFTPLMNSIVNTRVELRSP